MCKIIKYILNVSEIQRDLITHHLYHLSVIIKQSKHKGNI